MTKSIAYRQRRRALNESKRLANRAYKAQLLAQGRNCGNCDHKGWAFSIGYFCELSSGGGVFCPVQSNDVCAQHKDKL